MKFDSIMKTQIGEKEFIPSDQIINEYFVDDDLPQDVLIESLIVSQIQQPQTTSTPNDINNTNNNNNNNDNKNSKPSEEISSENVVNVISNVSNSTSNANNDQYLADLLLAMDLQQAEEDSFKQRRAHDEMYNGKYTKVRETAPKVTTNDVTFYYDMDELGSNNNSITNLTISNNNDDNNNGDLKSKRKRRRKNKKTENNENENVVENNDKTSTDKKPIKTKHDPIVWNQKHCQRLKAYEAMGDVNANDMHISNKAFNAIRYRLERKGFTKDPPEMNM